MAMTSQEREGLLAECRRLLEHRLRAQDVYDITAEQRIARLIARLAEDEERAKRLAERGG
jgi:hypothetical protein